MPATEPVKGAAELNRAFALAGTRFLKLKRTHFRSLAQPVERRSEITARTVGVERIWSQMRSGATPGTAYVASEARGTRIVSRKRPKFVGYMQRRVFAPAVDASRSEVTRQYKVLVDRLIRFWERGG